MSEAPTRDLMQFCPRYDDPAKDAVMSAGWLGCLQWAVTNQDIIDAFESETGRRLPRPRTPLERMVDEACGLRMDDLMWEYLSAFAAWMTENVWGEDNDDEEEQA